MTFSFKVPDAPIEVPETPEQLFKDLPKRGAGSLWSHQADMLRSYHGTHLDSKDVALELPTGSGKTLLALLIAEWTRMKRGGRVAYACPTVQLANQVHIEAVKQGISTVVLHGPHRTWDPGDRSRYESASAVAITTYSSIFNLNPAIAIPDLLLLDDAHAGEQFVSQAWSLEIPRGDDLYGRLLTVLEPGLERLIVNRLRADETAGRIASDINLIPPTLVQREIVEIDRTLSQASGDMFFRYRMLRPGLACCLMYASWQKLLIRPYIPPTDQHPAFADPRQRLYISATLGEGGELERSFGRPSIERLPVPAGWEDRVAGRRFFLFPELVEGGHARPLTRDLLDEAEKGLLITPSREDLRQALATIKPDDTPTFGKDEIESSLDHFGAADRGLLALANRYDGLDLSDDSCRLTILDGLPDGQHLQEIFLVSALASRQVLDERVRTRITQGSGRCTRGLQDHSVVVILGADLTFYLQRPEVLQTLRAEAQAEIQFGLLNSTARHEDLLSAVERFMAQDDAWDAEAEPAIANLRRRAVRKAAPGTDVLAMSAKKEVRAWSLAWQGDYQGAAQISIEIAQVLANGELRGYRAFWLYLASGWRAMEGETEGLESAAALLARAHKAAPGSSFLSDRGLSDTEVVLSPVDSAASAAASRRPARTMGGAKWADEAERLRRGLEERSAAGYEASLSALGLLLGANAYKPAGKGRADSVWLFGSDLWLTLEAKSEAWNDGLVSMDDVRQTNTQMTSLAKDTNTAVAAQKASILITPKRLADPDAADIADDHVFLVSVDDISELAGTVLEVWTEIRSQTHGLEKEEAERVTGRLLHAAGVLPEMIYRRLTLTPVAATAVEHA
jgi:hypothetical protein